MTKQGTLMLFFMLALLGSACDETSPSTEGQGQANGDLPGEMVDQASLMIWQAKIRDQKTYELISGRVIPKNETQVVAEVQGLIVAGPLALKPGARFQRGDLLLSIDSKEFTLSLYSQKSAFLNSLTGVLSDLKSDFPQSFPRWKAYLDRYEIAQSLEELPEAQSESERFFIASRGIYTSFFGIKAQEERLKKYSIRAPFDGVVLMSTVDIGAVVSPGQLLATFSSSKEFELETGGSVPLTSRMRVGDQLKFTSNDYPGEWTGTLVRIGAGIDPKTQNIPLYFRISGPNPLAGMYLQAKVLSDQLDQVAVIPSVLLDKDNSVLLLDQNEIKGKVVEPITFSDDSVSVRGLKEGEKLILNRFSTPMIGRKVANP